LRAAVRSGGCWIVWGPSWRLPGAPLCLPAAWDRCLSSCGPCQAGFEGVDERLEQAARTLGRTELSIFFTITLPLAWRAVIAGTVLAFARAFGDFGMTLMVAGNIPGQTRTLPLAIYDHVQANEMREANILALIAIGVVVLLLFGVGRVARVRY
jgi:molybdate transport system permease protein